VGSGGDANGGCIQDEKDECGDGDQKREKVDRETVQIEKAN
jgi:hypothetical protein